MTVVKRKPIPIYSKECPSMGAVAINPVRYECTKPKDEEKEDSDVE